MLGLLYKDFCVMKKNVLGTMFGCFLYSIPLFVPASTWEITGHPMTFTFTILPAVLYMTMFACISIVQNNLFEQDERKIWSSYITATPLGYRGQVRSKYAMSLILSFAVVIWGYICDMISSLSSGSVGSASNIYVTYFYIQTIMQAFEYPFLIRFGHKYGNTFKLGLFIAAFYGIMVYLLFGRIPETLSEDFFGFLIGLATSEKALPTFLLGILALLPYVAAGLYYVSYKVSCKWYLKGVEAYEV